MYDSGRRAPSWGLSESLGSCGASAQCANFETHNDQPDLEMTGRPMRRVIVLQETLPAYRVELLTHVRELATKCGIDVNVVHGMAPGERGERLNTGVLTGATIVDNHYLRVPNLDQPLVWQPALRQCLSADLVVVEQANRLLINYLLLLAQRARRLRLAFWGHGRNLQSSALAPAERFKSRFVATPFWWFAYTEGVANYLSSRGVPASRITVVGNTIDVRRLRTDIDRLRTNRDANSARSVFIGGLYPHKRLDFLFAAADNVALRVSNFELHIAGSGEHRSVVERFVASRHWAHYWGSVEGERRAELLASARLVLMPGLVGLVQLDSFAAGAPLVTTADALHSPEVEYLKDGVNGVLLPAGSSPDDYANAVVELLRDPVRWRTLSEGARNSADHHTIEAAANRFVHGLERALTCARSPDR